MLATMLTPVTEMPSMDRHRVHGTAFEIAEHKSMSDITLKLKRRQS